MTAMIHWRGYFRNILPENIDGIDVVLENSCGEPFTLQINGKEVEAVGTGDLHDTSFEGTWERTAAFSSDALNDGTESGILLHSDGCQYSVRVYPSQVFFDAHHTSTPIIITVCIIGVFLFTIFMFLLYDRLGTQWFLYETRQTFRKSFIDIYSPRPPIRLFFSFQLNDVKP